MTRVLASLILLILLIQCTAPEDTVTPIRIDGRVLNQTNEDPIASAIVRLFSPDSQKTSQTDSNGDFSFSLGVDTTMDLSLIISKEGFVSDTLDALAIPDRDINLSNIYLSPTSDGGTGDDSTGTGGTSPDGPTGPANILLAGTTVSTITVIGSGGTDNTTIRFQVLDSTGISAGKDIQVDFSVGSNPGGGEYLSPSSAFTDKNGQVSVNLVSGTVSGVVQILASISVGSTTIQSQAVPITIHGGLPDQDHFGIVSSQVNFAGYNIWGLVNTITAFAGDKYGNFCTPGVAVYFTTTGGLIDGSSQTSDGTCAVPLVSGPPKPEHPTMGKGFATITARTADESNSTIQDSIVVLFSGYPVIKNISPASFSIPDSGSVDFSFEVTDENNNPLAPGTNIAVALEGENAALQGDVSTILPDTQVGGNGLTQFSFTAYDDNLEVSIQKSLRIVITVGGPNGNARTTLSGTGY